MAPQPIATTNDDQKIAKTLLETECLPPLVAVYLEPSSLSRFRNANRSNRKALQFTLINALSLEHGDDGRRYRLVRTFPFERGNAAAIHALVKRLEDTNYSVLTAVLDKLPEIAEEGNVTAIKAVAKRCEDANDDVRRAAVRAYSQIAGNATAIKMLAKRSEHTNEAVRCGVVDSFVQIAKKGSATAIEALAKRLEDAEDRVRFAAGNALAKIAERGNAIAIEALSKRLNDASAWKQPDVDSLSVVDAFLQIAERGNAAAMKTLAKRLEDADHFVRTKAVFAVGRIAEKGNATAIEALAKRLEDAERSVRGAAVHALAQLAEEGNAASIDAVAKLLEDAEKRVRVSAVRAVAEIAERGNATAIEAVAKRIEDANVAVRRAAVDALANIAEKGNATAIDALAKRLKDFCDQCHFRILEKAERSDEEGDTRWGGASKFGNVPASTGPDVSMSAGLSLGSQQNALAIFVPLMMSKSRRLPLASIAKPMEAKGNATTAVAACLTRRIREGSTGPSGEGLGGGASRHRAIKVFLPKS